MKLVDMKVTEFLDVLKSDAPAPGGGSVSALSGAEGCALFMMVCDLTLGKEKYAEHQEVCQNAKTSGLSLYEELLEGIDKDTEAFNLIADAFKMPKETDEDKAARRAAIAHGSLVATEVPFHNMELALEGLRLAASIVGKSNPNCASDLGVGILQLKACVSGAWMNVKINLPSVKAEEKAAFFAEEGQKIYEEARAIADEAYEKVLETL